MVDDMLALASSFVHAIEAGDLAAVRACFAPGAKVWHNTDDVEQTVDETLDVLAWFVQTMPDLRFRVLHREVLQGGFLQQHVLEATLPDGTPWKMHACVVVTVQDGSIERIDEYLDSGASAIVSVR